jgi:hypothetical protein
MPRTMSMTISNAYSGDRLRLTINVAEATCLALLGVVKTSSPVDGDVAFTTVQSGGTFHATTSADTAELEKSVKNRTIITHIIFSLLFCERVHVIRSNLLQEIDVLVSMELGHLVLGSWFCALKDDQFSFNRSDQREIAAEFRSSQEADMQSVELGTYIDLHLLVNTIVHNQAMRQSNAVGLHWMASDISIIANVGVIEVGNPLLIARIIEVGGIDWGASGRHLESSDFAAAAGMEVGDSFQFWLESRQEWGSRERLIAGIPEINTMLCFRPNLG